MKTIGILGYGVNDVFQIFMRNAKKDFSDFNEEDPIGCKIKKSIKSVGPKPLECKIEITDYTKNEKYQITTSTNFTNCTSTCVSTYTFVGQKDGTTKLVFEEEQSTDRFVSYMTIWFQRFMARRNFKAKCSDRIEWLNKELKVYFSNIDRSKCKNKTITD